jgi:hypothetical protein
VQRWRSNVLGLRSIHDRLQMFSSSAAIEEEFEPIESVALDAAADMDWASSKRSTFDGENGVRSQPIL